VVSGCVSKSLRPNALQPNGIFQVTVAREIPAYAGCVFILSYSRGVPASDSGAAFTQVISSSRSRLDMADYVSFSAYEFSKRKFSKTYGTQLPVWALLASGSTGGVCVPALSLFSALIHNSTGCLLASVLSIGCGQVPCSTS